MIAIKTAVPILSVAVAVICISAINELRLPSYLISRNEPDFGQDSSYFRFLKGSQSVRTNDLEYGASQLRQFGRNVPKQHHASISKYSRNLPASAEMQSGKTSLSLGIPPRKYSNQEGPGRVCVYCNIAGVNQLPTVPFGGYFHYVPNAHFFSLPAPPPRMAGRPCR